MTFETTSPGLVSTETRAFHRLSNPGTRPCKAKVQKREQTWLDPTCTYRPRQMPVCHTLWASLASIGRIVLHPFWHPQTASIANKRHSDLRREYGFLGPNQLPCATAIHISHSQLVEVPEQQVMLSTREKLISCSLSRKYVFANLHGVSIVRDRHKKQQLSESLPLPTDTYWEYKDTAVAYSFAPKALLAFSFNSMASPIMQPPSETQNEAWCNKSYVKNLLFVLAGAWRGFSHIWWLLLFSLVRWAWSYVCGWWPWHCLSHNRNIGTGIHDHY